MDLEHLHDRWSMRGKSRSASQLQSYRLPNYIAAQIDALCEIYPKKNRTEIVTDLLQAALIDLESSLPEEKGAPMVDRDGFGPPRIGGIRGQFRELSNSKFYELESSRGGYFEPIFNESIPYSGS